MSKAGMVRGVAHCASTKFQLLNLNLGPVVRFDQLRLTNYVSSVNLFLGRSRLLSDHRLAGDSTCMVSRIGHAERA